MGREVMRVPLDFEWPISKLWHGYLMPERLSEESCDQCQGSGATPAYNWLMGVAYILGGLADDYGDEQRGRPMHPWLTPLFEISYVRANERPGPEFAAVVNGLAREEIASSWFGAQPYRIALALTEAASLPEDWGHCPACAGHGSTERYEGQRAEAEAWERTEPPTGEGWQLWTTTNEGAPMTPVFATAEELAQHCDTARVSWFGRDTATADEWLRSFLGEGIVGMKVIAPGVVMM